MRESQRSAGSSALLGPADVRRPAVERDVRSTKKFGQNFVHDPMASKAVWPLR
ncbi:hypothetical protein [Actinoalloteichus sp. GBA129-24]|uniref:hypothetical protein n=1 Tax=Actinoalloteichus sp. GBA129-24 TaxID=1612551 RepID=UPI00399A1BCB